jgi:hypothetical protein
VAHFAVWSLSNRPKSQRVTFRSIPPVASVLPSGLKATTWNPIVPSSSAALLSLSAPAADEPKPLGPVEARKQVGKEITVRMEVKTAKDRLEKRGEIYLDAEEDFKDEKNFAVVITKKGAASLKEAGVADPAAHYKGKKITA